MKKHIQWAFLMLACFAALALAQSAVAGLSCCDGDRGCAREYQKCDSDCTAHDCGNTQVGECQKAVCDAYDGDSPGGSANSLADQPIQTSSNLAWDFSKQGDLSKHTEACWTFDATALDANR